MFRSFVSRDSALWTERNFGVDAQLASVFDFAYKSDGIRFSVLGPGGSEIFQGAVKAQTQVNSSSGEAIARQNDPQPSRDGYHMQPYVGIPGVLGAGQARYVCAFSKSISVIPVISSEPFQAGKLLAEFDFRPEGVLHLPNASVMQFPPWGYQTSSHSRQTPASGSNSPARKPTQSADSKVGPGLANFFSGAIGNSVSEEEDSDIQDCTNGCRPRIPWKDHAASHAAEEISDPSQREEFPWKLHEDTVSKSAAPSTRPQASRSHQARPRATPGLGTLLSEL
jgi:hypothetical protein